MSLTLIVLSSLQPGDLTVQCLHSHHTHLSLAQQIWPHSLSFPLNVSESYSSVSSLANLTTQSLISSECLTVKGSCSSLSSLANLTIQSLIASQCLIATGSYSSLSSLANLTMQSLIPSQCLTAAGSNSHLSHLAIWPCSLSFPLNV